jgi:choline dehydrogenase-like flavoprotein
MADLDCDVLVVGYGPVGQTLTILLARQGHRVTVLERQERPYPRPRAVHFDDEIARVFAAGELIEEIAAISQPSGEYDWRNAAGRTLLHFDWGSAGPRVAGGQHVLSAPAGIRTGRQGGLIPQRRSAARLGSHSADRSRRSRRDASAFPRGRR